MFYNVYKHLIFLPVGVVKHPWNSILLVEKNYQSPEAFVIARINKKFK